jgi:hypothetical protein
VLKIGDHLIVLAAALVILILGFALFWDSAVLDHLAAQDQALALFHPELGSLRLGTEQQSANPGERRTNLTSQGSCGMTLYQVDLASGTTRGNQSVVSQ